MAVRSFLRASMFFSKYFTVLTRDRKKIILVFPEMMSIVTTDAFNSCEKVIQELKRQLILGLLCKKSTLMTEKGLLISPVCESPH